MLLVISNKNFCFSEITVSLPYLMRYSGRGNPVLKRYKCLRTGNELFFSTALCSFSEKRVRPLSALQALAKISKGFFIGFMVSAFHIDEDFLEVLDRHELFLLLHISAKIDNSKRAILSMRDLQKSTLWHYKKVISTRQRLVEKGIIYYNPPFEDETGYVKQEYVIISDNVKPLNMQNHA